MGVRFEVAATIAQLLAGGVTGRSETVPGRERRAAGRRSLALTKFFRFLATSQGIVASKALDALT
jgi:hypothetical protein